MARSSNFSPGLEAGQNILGLLFGAHKDVPGPHPLGLGNLGGFRVIGGLDLFVGHLRADLLEKIGIAQGLGLVEGQAPLVFIRIGNAFLDRQLGQQVALDQELDNEGIAQLRRQIRQLADDVIGGHLHFRNLDLVAIDDGDDLVFLYLLRPGAERHGARQESRLAVQSSHNLECVA